MPPRPAGDAAPSVSAYVALILSIFAEPLIIFVIAILRLPITPLPSRLPCPPSMLDYYDYRHCIFLLSPFSRYFAFHFMMPPPPPSRPMFDLPSLLIIFDIIS